ARRTATTRKCTLHHQRWVGTERNLVTALAKILETGFVDDRRTDDLGVADLHGLFAAMRVVANRRQRKLSDARIVLVVPHVLVTHRQGVSGSELEVEPRADIEYRRRARNRLVIGNDVVTWVQDLGGNHGFVVNIALLHREEKRSVLPHRPTDVSVKDFGVIAWLFRHERIEGVEGGRITIHQDLAMHLVRSRLGENLDASVAQLVVLGGERVLVDANLTDGRLGRELAGGKSVN